MYNVHTQIPPTQNLFKSFIIIYKKLIKLYIIKKFIKNLNIIISNLYLNIKKNNKKIKNKTL